MRLSCLLIFFSLEQVINKNSAYVAPSLFVNHGGGPMPLLGDEDELEVAEGMKNASKYIDLKQLNAFIVVTAHWEEKVVTISSSNHHSLLYDYYYFPPESYTFKYNAPGQSVLAEQIHEALKNKGIPSKLDNKRGWDHGVFIPLMLINPRANIPVVQVSILKNYNAEQHYEIGRVLYQFRKQGVAIIGSGMSYHNMSAFMKSTGNFNSVIVNENFDNYLNKICTGDEEERRNIVTWKQVPGALDAHPRRQQEHFMPLVVNIGASGPHPGKNIFHSVYDQKFMLSGFLWEGDSD